VTWPHAARRIRPGSPAVHFHQSPEQLVSPAYLASVFVHIIAAFVWVGGMLFLGIVGAPVLRRIEPAGLRQQLFQQLGLRFRSIGWSAIVVLLVTGLINLHYRGWLRWTVLGEPGFWRTGVGYALAGKLLGAALMVVLSAVHDFGIGPAAGRAKTGSPRALTMRRRAALLARVNALVAILVVLAAVLLVRGG
jgi:copper resistance protein D